MIIKKSERVRHENSEKCTAYEYPFDEKDINLAYIEIDGRYPDSGFALNREVKEMLFVASGTGSVTIEGERFEISEGDVVLIRPGKRYFIEGSLRLVVPCHPSWNPEQYEILDDDG